MKPTRNISDSVTVRVPGTINQHTILHRYGFMVGCLGALVALPSTMVQRQGESS